MAEPLHIPFVAVFLGFEKAQIRRQPARDDTQPMATRAVLVVAGIAYLDRLEKGAVLGHRPVGVFDQPLFADIWQGIGIHRLRSHIAMGEGHGRRRDKTHRKGQFLTYRRHATKVHSA